MKLHFLLIPFLFPTLLVQSQTTKPKTINGRMVDQTEIAMTPGIRTDCDTIFSFPTSDHYPVGLTYDGTQFYSVGLVSPMIYTYNLDGQLIDSIPYPGPDLAGEGGGDIDFDGTNLWLVMEQQRKLIKLDLSTGDTTSFILPSSDGGDPDNWGCAYDNGYIWNTEYQDRTLMRIDATTGALVDSFFINRAILPLKIIKGDLYGVEFLDSPIGKFQLVKFDKNTGAALDSIPWCLHHPLGIAWADEHLWGLSTGTIVGTDRIYEFENLLSSTDHSVSSNRSVTIFPNPATNHITVSGSGTIQMIELFTVIGGKVFSKTGLYQTMPYDLDLSGFQKGIYFIRIFDGLKFYVEKIVVE